MTNQANEELKQKLRDTKTFNYNVYFGVDGGDNAISFDEALDEIVSIIRTEKLKLLAEVRERVVGEKTSPNFDNEYGYCINCEFQPTDGTKHCLCYYDEKLRKKQRTALNKLEAEL